MEDTNPLEMMHDSSRPEPLTTEHIDPSETTEEWSGEELSGVEFFKKVNQANPSSPKSAHDFMARYDDDPDKDYKLDLIVDAIGCLFGYDNNSYDNYKSKYDPLLSKVLDQEGERVRGLAIIGKAVLKLIVVDRCMADCEDEELPIYRVESIAQAAVTDENLYNVFHATELSELVKTEEKTPLRQPEAAAVLAAILGVAYRDSGDGWIPKRGYSGGAKELLDSMQKEEVSGSAQTEELSGSPQTKHLPLFTPKEEQSGPTHEGAKSAPSKFDKWLEGALLRKKQMDEEKNARSGA